ncbi:MAG: MCM family protein, partial [Candidatus Methanomethylicota archaeon]
MVIELIEQDPRERFANFFKSFQTPDGEYKYRKRLSQMAITGQKSLLIDFEDLMQFDHELAEQVIEKPTRYLEAASYAVGDVMRIVNLNYAMKVREFRARFRRLPELTPLRKIRAEHLGKLIMIEGILTRASSVKQQLIRGVFECPRCGTKIPVESKSEGERVTPPDRCANPDCRYKGPFKLLLEESTFIDWQRLTIQEKPEELPPGQLPRSIDAIARGDIVDVARPGDRVVVVGVLKPRPEFSPRGRLTTYSPILEINSIDVAEKGLEEIEITPEDEEKIKELAKDPFIHQKIIQSIAPSIYGYEEIKEGIAYLLFGGVPKQLPDGVRIRGDINILLVGDPGTAKSQLLQYVARIAPRGIYTSGKGSTAAGLTAAVVRDKVTGDWYLEAGALVLADGGVACIDEIDKMRSEDRVAMHEAMEQQSYHKDFEILLADGTKIKIGKLVDKLMSNHKDNIIKGKDTEILFVDNIYVMAYDLSKKEIVKVKADRISRHKAPSKFIQLTFSNGRTITVTPEHPIVIWSNGKITTIRADQAKVGMIVPGVNRYEISKSSREGLDEILETLNIDAKSLAKFIGFVLSDGFTYSNPSNRYYEIGFTNTNQKLVGEFKSLLKSFNIKFNERVSSKNREKRLHTIRIISKSLYELLWKYLPEIFTETKDEKTRPSRLKRIPAILFKMPNDAKKAFINTFFKGDGFVDNYRAGFRTSSRKLAEDLQDLLLTLGIYSYMYNETSKEGRTYYKVIISGTDNLAKFVEIVADDERALKIKNLIEKSKSRLNYRNELPNDIAEVLREIANELDINDGYLSTIVKRKHNIHFEKARKYIEQAEVKIRELKRALTEENVSNLRKFIKLTRLSKELKIPYSTLRYRLIVKKDPEITKLLIKKAYMKLHEIEEKLNKLRNFIDGNIRFLTIKQVSVVENKDSEWVYDVTVEPHH